MNELWLFLALILVGSGAAVMRLRERRKIGRSLTLATLAVGLIALAIPGLVGGLGQEEPPLVVVIDASFSMGVRLDDFVDLDELRGLEARELLVILAGQWALPLFEGPAAEIGSALAAPLAFRDPLFRTRADLGAALELARERLGARAFEVVLVSDGGFEPAPSETGDIVSARAVAGPRRRRADLALDFVGGPPMLAPDQSRAIGLRLEGRLDGPRSIAVVVEGQGRIALDLPAGPIAEDLRFEVAPPWPTGGFLSARLEPAGADVEPGNDEARLPFLVPEGSARPLLLLQGARGAAALRGRLEAAEGLRVLPAAASLDQARIVLIDSLPAEGLPFSPAELRAYVLSGGGLLLTGHEEAFGAGGWEGTVLDELSPLAARPGRRPRLLRFALDRSGSMAQEGRLAAAASSVRALFKSLGPDDALELILFAASRERRLYLRDDAGAAARLAADLAAVGAAGGTDLRGLLDELARPPGEGEEREIVTVIASDGRDPRGLDRDFAGRIAARMKANGLGLQLFWFDRDEALRPAMELLVGQPGRLHEVDDFGRLLEPFFAALGEELEVEDVRTRLGGGVEIRLPHLLRTRRVEGVEVLAAGGEDENALARIRRGLGRVAAAPVDPVAAEGLRLFGPGGLEAFLVELADRPAGFELARVPGEGGERLELRGGDLPRRSLRLVSAVLELPLRPITRDRAETATRPDSAPDGVYHLVDGGGRDLGAVLLGPPRRRDLGPRPEPTRLAAQARKLGGGAETGRRPPLLLPFGLILLFGLDLLLRSRGR